MEVTNESEIWTLFQALLQCKFGEHSCSLELAGSEPLAQVMDRVWADFLLTRVSKIASPQGGWDIWRELTPDRVEWNRVVLWIKRSKTWSSWTAEQKQQYVNILASPYVVTQSYLKILLES